MRLIPDLRLFLPTIVISGLSGFLIWSTNSHLLANHAAAIGIGLAVFFIISQLRLEVLQKSWLILYIILFAGLLLLFTQPEIRGAQRWLIIGPLSIQIGEIGKPLYIIALAGLFSNFLPRTAKNFLILVLAGILPILLIAKQPDLGDAVLYSAVWLGLSLTGHIRFRFLAVLLFIGAVLLPLGWRSLADYQRERLVSFVQPDYDPQGIGYNAAQALIAVGSGKFWGRGLGQGTQSHLQFLPESYTDFIFASLTEELGFLGGAILLVAYSIMLYRILTLALATGEIFPRLLAIGAFTQLFSQLFVNIGMNLGIVPITGVTLPLVSYGGSSMVSTFMVLGLVQVIANSKPQQELVIR